MSDPGSESLHEVRLAGDEALAMATRLLQRARRADAEAGVWEAADVQWWSRLDGPAGVVEKPFWLDDDGPVAGVLLNWAAQTWQCDPVVVPGTTADAATVWAAALELGQAHAPDGYDLPVSDDDPVFSDLAQRAGLAVGSSDSTAWMTAADRPEPRSLPDGFALVDRAQRQGTPHPMRNRTGPEVADRLARLSLYDPSLDLAVEAPDGEVAGYSLYWFDPVTKVGLVEPVRVEDAYQRRGLASAMLCAGLDRLAALGAERMKVSFSSDAAASTYAGVGFQRRSTTTWYTWAPAGLER